MKIYISNIAKIALVLAFAAGIALFPAHSNAQSMAHITSQLDQGARGSEITALQTFLATQHDVYPEGLITGYFGPLTASAVTRFQIKYGLEGVGRVGPLTMAKINSLIDGGAVATVAADPIINNVMVAANTTTSTTSVNSAVASITWTSDRPVIGKVYYSTTPLTFTESSGGEPAIGGSVVNDNTLSSAKAITLNSLSPRTTYYYMVDAVDAGGNASVTWPATFQTQ